MRLHPVCAALTATISLALLAPSAKAVVLGYTSFEEPATTSTPLTAADIDGTSKEFTAQRYTPGVGQTELGFGIYMPTFTAGETFEVTNFGVTSANGGNFANEYLQPDGTLDATAKGFALRDAPNNNETMQLVLDAVDTTGAVGDVMFSFSLVVLPNSGNEAADFFRVVLSDGVNQVTVVNWSETELEANDTPDASPTPWNQLTFNVTELGLTGNITATFEVNLDGGTENLFIDNVVFDAVPEPASLALLGLGGGLIFARTRRQSA